MHRGYLGLLLIAGAAFLLAGCSGTPEPAKPGGEAPKAAKTEGAKMLRIAVIPKGTTHEFWKSIHAGAKKAEQELTGVQIDWQGPIVEDDRRAQIDLVETFIQKHVDGIVLAPLDDKALVLPVQAASRAGIPVVIIDSDLADPEAYESFVATDNTKGGMLGGQRLAEVLGANGGRVILLRYQVGSASTENREKGFLEEMARHPNIEVVSSNQYAGPTVETAMTAAQSLLTKFGEGQVDGIFCPNESSAYGMLQALRTAGRAGKVRFVGFDVSAKLLEALKAGEMQGLVLQNPFRMGHDGVATVVSRIRGQKVPKRVDTGVVLATAENLADPQVDRLIHPPVE